MIDFDDINKILCSKYALFPSFKELFALSKKVFLKFKRYYFSYLNNNWVDFKMIFNIFDKHILNKAFEILMHLKHSNQRTTIQILK